VTTAADKRTLTAQEERKRTIGLKLSAIHRKFLQQFNQSAEQSGMSRAKWTLIAVVARIPGATQRQIADTLDVTEVTAGRLIDRLCEDGYLERHENPEDRRSYSIYLTDAAHPVLETLGEIAAVHTDKAFAGLDEADLIRLDALLDVVSNNLGAMRR
jgi:MarR family transcriptional regulator for hemolysin